MAGQFASQFVPATPEDNLPLSADSQEAVASLAVSVTDEPSIFPKVEVVLPEPELEDLIVALSHKYETDANLALAIARCESGLTHHLKDGSVIRGRVNRYDVGLFQINEQFHKKKSAELGFDIYTAEGNTGYAMWMLKHSGSKPWKASKPCWSKHELALAK